MISTTVSGKRPIEQVDDELLSLTAQQENEEQQQQRKRRRHQFAPMTQFNSNTLDEDSGFRSSSDVATVDQDNFLEESPSGYIKKVILRNFMCHEHFELELGSRLNFIVGNNGSGKSAILTAITIGLGAKASETNRGSSLKDLIREGCYSAKITLHLDNSKYGAYQQGIFGNEIIVERIIKRDGPASFSLRSENGKEISNKKKDIQTVVDYFSVPVSNPMCFLSQDAARSFLTASTSQDKYSHFMKGTLLQEITENLLYASAIHDSAQENMALHLENLKSLKAEYEDAKKLLRELNQTSDLNERKMLLQAKSLWIDVAHNTDACKNLENEISGIQQKVDEVTEKIRNRQEKIERYTSGGTTIEAQIDAKVIYVNEKDSEHQNARELLRDVKSRFEKEKSNQAEAQSNIDQGRKKVDALNKTIAHLEEELTKEMGGDKDQMRQELEQLEKANEKLREVNNSLVVSLQDVKNEERDIQHERESELRTISRSIQNKKVELQNIAKGNDTFLMNFDRNMDRLLRTIEQRKNEFETPPIGPLGSFVTIRKGFEKWTRSIQRAISSSLNAFVVSNPKDNRLFRDIMRSCGIRSNIPIVTYRLSQFDYSKGRAHGNYPTIVDALEFSKPEIECLFVDLSRIERIVLIEDKNEARNFLQRNPVNVNMALSLRDRRSGFQLSGGYRLDTVTYQDKIRLKVNSSSDNGTQYLKDLIEQETKELQNIRDRYEEKLSEVRSRLKEIDGRLKSTKNEMRKTKFRMTELKMNVGKVVDTGILNSKINERKNQEQAIASYEAAKEELGLKIEQIAQEAQPIKEQYDSTKLALVEAQDELQQLKEDINSRQSKIQKYKDDTIYYEDKKKVYLENIKKIEVNVAALKEGIQRQIQNACAFCSKERIENVDLPDTQEEIKRELDKVSRMIQKAEKSLGLSQEEVIALFEKCRNKYKEGQKKYMEIDEALNRLHNSLKARDQNYKNAEKGTCFDADMDFRASLKVRKFSGNLSFIKDTKSLEIYILTTNDEKARNVDTLSGGEKSFSQMALLLATWKPMRSRIIALDEFDVFMDQVNRKIGTTLIVKKLKDIARTQTIIITPQDIGKIADIDSSGVSIHRMRDPERQNNSNFYN
ncbi:BFH_collapsed_G0038890.mRNA.1.CDS.1 [Saccharomyces cerevisiae]|nr:BFH_HP2_G0037950.mRNA.1.CDS.1 [Saccharomyces cerevisiae]CAI6667249.1 BFH_HP2_G0037950.mRNA.1.CDS.1 [Saccharomyces cerevisiae]CAI6679254.1 BFH_HP1_G0038320.mRNA.1.CDS.1 [Saccharomyces cerevisiae]CAI7253660.1 BFH_collapsed_G0038890.mRNA.1.CDS.1 [Saccharomyces cerevisiae]